VVKTTRAVVVERPGMLTTIQDGGRVGFQALGVPVAGPMDPWSARLANRLVGNADGAALLEVTLIGPRLLMECDAAVAVAGAEFEIAVGSRTVRSPCVTRLRAGEVLAFHARGRGARAYVAFDGGLEAPRTLGSAATHVWARMGGLGGTPLRDGDRVPLGAAVGLPVEPAPLAGATPSTAPSARCLVLPGPDTGPWAAEAHRALCAVEFEVSTESDRMGYRLRGQTRWPEPRGGLISFPTVAGAIQLPPGGEPILLMADRQTTGGYPVIGVVSRASRPTAGQLAPGDRVRFAPVSWDEAAQADRQLEAALDRLAARVVA
jgi:biotin-dependent carboxylase-like uncharacterized protein